MEFLDDLREQRKAGKQGPQKQTAAQESANADQDPWEALLGETDFDETGATAPDTPRTGRKKSRQADGREKTRTPKPQREKPQRAKAERERQPAKPTRPGYGGARRRLSGGQKVVVGVLTLLVLGIWIGIAAVLAGAVPLGNLLGAGVPAAPVTAPVGALSVGHAPVGEPATTPAVPTPTAAAEAVQPMATPKPTASPVPLAMVSTVYDSQIARDPDNIELYLKRGADYLRMGVYAAALADYQHVLTLDDQHSMAYVGLGWSQYYVFAWDEAEAAFAAATALDENAAEAYFGLGLLHYYQGAYAQAVRDFDWAAEINPLNAEAEAWLAMSAAREGDLQEARDAVDRAMLVNQKLPILYIARSWVHKSENPPNLEGAHGDLLYALNLGPNHFLTLNALAGFYAEHRSDRLSEGEVRAIYAGEWAANDVERALALQTLGRVYLSLDRQEDAARVLMQAMDLATVNGKTYLVGLVEDLARTQ
jgi:tetratricopeptide (TPR) repeat protein